VYSQTGDKTAQNALIWFEQLRNFFRQKGPSIAGFTDQGRPPLRVIGFRSEKEYAQHRLHPLAEAYYASDGNGDYIIMSKLDSSEFRVAAHEYAHYVVHASGLKLPAWLHEGLAEFFATLGVNESGYSLGGDLPARTHTLQQNRNNWLPLAGLLNIGTDSTISNGRKDTEIFYAESWALVDMLIAAPPYAPRFWEVVSALNAGASGEQAFRRLYAKSLDAVAKDLENWVGRRHTPKIILSRPAQFESAETSQLSDLAAGTLEAKVLLVSGHLEQAKTRFEELARQAPDNPDLAAALAAIANRQGNRDEALRLWRKALNNNLKDAEMCYRYALLAEEAGMSPQDVRAGLERAVLLAPGFDDARYKLALIQYQAGEYKLAVDHLRTMRVPVAEQRRYGYWTALASALVELHENDEARAAALEAAKNAKTENERMTARRIALIAGTDMTVQFATDSEGHSQIVTTRVPHGTTDWNPFIEPSDQMQHANGKLSEVLCEKGKLTGFLLLTPSGTVTLDVVDPLHVLMRNSPSEFYCGPFKGDGVGADYAVVRTAGKARNVLRGMTFQR
jgi:tetratricopeptide (TPR) repeat protein